MSKIDEERYEAIAERCGECAAFTNRITDSVANQMQVERNERREVLYENQLDSAFYSGVSAALQRVRAEAKRRDKEGRNQRETRYDGDR